MNNPKKEYEPSPLRIATLEHDETQKFSFRICECEKTFLEVYRVTQLFFDCHFTNKRLILENVSVPGWYNMVLKSIFFVLDAPPGAETQSKLNIDQDKKKADAKEGMFFEIPYSEIKAYERVKLLGLQTPTLVRITLLNSQRDFVIAPNVIPKRHVKNVLAYRAADFIELGNELLNCC